MLGLENRGQDQAVVVNVYGWFDSSALYSDNSSTSTFTTCLWGTFYKTIYSCNNLLKGIIDANTDDPELLCYIAQAKAMRAWAYTNLVQLYCKPYTVNPQAPGIPVITEANDEAAATEGVSRGTVADVYAQILSDLDYSIDMLLKVYPGRYDKRFVDPAVAYGLRARAYLLMGKVLKPPSMPKPPCSLPMPLRLLWRMWRSRLSTASRSAMSCGASMSPRRMPTVCTHSPA